MEFYKIDPWSMKTFMSLPVTLKMERVNDSVLITYDRR
jgi:hypothetical protein